MLTTNLFKAGRCIFRPSYMQTRTKYGLFKDGSTHARLNGLPIPKGDGHADNKRKNVTYNSMLSSGLVALIRAIYSKVSSSGIVYFNSEVPDHPYEDK